jgi:hypothetical protein
MKIFDLVKKILETNEQTRNSDKELIWLVYKKLGIVRDVEWFGTKEAILKEHVISGKMPSFETITRARRKVQELNPSLEATDSKVRSLRKQKQKTKGTFIFREYFK